MTHPLVFLCKRLLLQVRPCRDAPQWMSLQVSRARYSSITMLKGLDDSTRTENVVGKINLTGLGMGCDLHTFRNDLFAHRVPIELFNWFGSKVAFAHSMRNGNPGTRSTRNVIK